MAEKVKAPRPGQQGLEERLQRLEGDMEERFQRLEALLKAGGARPAHEPDKKQGARPHCTLKRVPERVFAADVSPDRARLIQEVGKKWVNGTTLHYYFFEEGNWAGDDRQQESVRQGFEVWKDVGIGVSFEEVTDPSEAEVRVGFLRGDGSWSYIGRDVIDVPGQGERTMNFGWDLRADPRGVDVPVHEIGHTLGFPHEHQNPFAGIVWDEEAVYKYFGGPPNSWPRETTFFNILAKLPASEVRGSQWDPDSIMHYAFGAGLILEPGRYHDGLTPAGGLSTLDVEVVRRFYPPLERASYARLTPFRSEPLALPPAGQKDFVLEPAATREYTIQLFGGSDNLMVLFEDRDGELKYVDGDDDSGTPRNARITVRMAQGHRYVLRVRHFVNYAGGESAVMVW